MSVFDKGETAVSRRVVIRNPLAAGSFDIPIGAHVTRVTARNRTATASNLTVGNAAAGAQFLASVAVPVGTTAAPGYVRSPAISVAPSNVVTNVHYTLSAYPAAPGIDIVIEYDELEDSLPLITQSFPVAY